MAEDESSQPDSQDPVPSDALVGQPTETVAADAPGRIPKQIGHFHIKRVIASGGMGTVFETVQEHPRRTVAVKVMKQGIASRSALRRFEYESQTLARLHHPGIAQVYEAGTRDDGTGPVPYFAMEYIPNPKTITEYARVKKLGTRQRLELFTQACGAVHHGHQKGIIHRDLKPANILVDSHGQVKIIDFGVARATDSDMAVTTLQTDVGQLIGTVQYMSPEQCEADPHDLDTRSDVYALGVVLYELLCERPPYDVSRVAVYEAARVIREQPPTKLSTIDRTLRGDVETIAHKALEKDRERRYQSADELRRDVRHYLSGDPISARPPSVAYQLRVFARRNKALFVGTAAVFAVLVAGIIVSTALYVRAEHARTQAAVERDRARAMNEFFKDMLQTVDPTADFVRPGGRGVTDLTAADMLRSAARTIEQRFADEPQLEAEVRGALGAAFLDIGENESAEAHYGRALELCRRIWGDDHEETLQMKMGYGRATRQIPYLREAHEGFRRLYGPHHRKTLAAADRLGLRLAWADQLVEAELVLTAALNMEPSRGQATERERARLFFTLAFVKMRRGDLPGYEVNAREGYEITMRVHDADSLAAAYAHLSLAYALFFRGKHPEAVAEARKVMPRIRRHLGTDHPGTVYMAVAVADVFIGAGEFEQAEQMLLEGVEAQRQRLGLAADEQPYTMQAIARLVQVYTRLGRLPEAARYAQKCLRGALRCGEDLDLNNASWAVVRSPGWEPHLYDLALEAAEKACGLLPSSTRLNTLGVAQYRTGRYEEALSTLRRADARTTEHGGGRQPCDVAFLAMALFQLAHIDEARAELDGLRQIMTEDPWQGDTESNDFLKEAEALIQQAPADGQSGERQVPLRDPKAPTTRPAAAPGEQTP